MAGYGAAMTQAPSHPVDPNATDIGGTPRAVTRPKGVAAPAHWAKDDGPPKPANVTFEPQSPKAGMPDPVRYGDWELKGVAVDF